MLTTRAMERGSAFKGVRRWRRTALLSPIMPVASRVSARVRAAHTPREGARLGRERRR
ncbi:hypothetical protein EMIHUDRAFT_458452 [Emiliania huxleyi CCMP1516]|uniref:Uncharacterized protein n=2 Tax=Emiliania huxleyi TaxID=2903 RepID=A0A0D3JCD4_EMIH1|nr:hypothetical protein EMIHUDRAFT_458452 [Emiliania huxleyi CCMP1516]EOD21169.1 hypothetical protein EMIHUDRAFT_458452 [Emiliania huxleyi CCMP1516]|eukprot:XP_005773598.1 hypothetical protein EMIHUDRAFT_458452 [Emiliania huxleyi CCMP1516]